MRLIIVAALLLSSCASPPQLVGPFANSLSPGDIRQIVDLARDRPDIKKPVDQIDAQRPYQAHVQSRTARRTTDIMSWFDVRKKNGRWEIIEESVITGRPERIIVTGGT